jgi:hypothetical protein
MEHANRERADPVSVHRVFQKSICKLRLRAAEEYLKVIGPQNGENKQNTEDVGFNTSYFTDKIFQISPR